MINTNDPRLTDYVLGELNEADHVEIQRALSKSPELERVVEEIRQTVDLLGAAYLTEEPLSLLDEQKAQLAQTRVLDSAVELKRPSVGRPWLRVVLAASLMGLLVGGAIYLQNPPMDPAVAKRVEELGKLDESQLRQLKAKTDSNKETEKTAARVAPESEIALAWDDEASLNAGLSGMKSLKKFQADDLSVADALNEKAGIQMANEGQSPRETRSPAEFRSDGEGPIQPTNDQAQRNGFGERESGQLNEPASAESRRQSQALGRDLTRNDEDAYSSGSESSSGNGQRLGGRGRMGDAGGGKFGGGGGGSGGAGDQLARGARAFAGEEAEELTHERMESDHAVIDDAFGQELPDQAANRSNQMRGAERSLTDTTAELDELAVDERSKENGLRSKGGQFPERADDQIRIPGRRATATPKPAPASVPPSGKGLTAKAPAQDMGDKSEFDREPTGLAGNHPGRSQESSAEAGVGVAGKDSSVVTGGSKVGIEAENFAVIQQEMKEIGLDVVMPSEAQQTRSVPDQPMSTEERNRSIKLADGSTVKEKFEIANPLGQDAKPLDGDQAQKRFYSIAPERSESLVEGLATKFDPDRKREFGLQELFFESKVEELELHETDKKLLGAIRRLKQLEESGAKSDFDSERLFQQLDESVQKRNAKVRKNRTWKRVKAIPNTPRLMMIGDKDELDLTGMQVNVQVDGFRARVLIDCFYYNDRGRQLEGNFKLRLPDDASLYYFAFGESAYDLQPQGQLAADEFFDDGTQFVSLRAPEIRKARKDAWDNVKEARMVPREKAAHAYRETVRRKVDPALVEWAGAGVFNARVFPIAPHKLHRIVIGYDVNLTKADGIWVYKLDLPEQAGQCRVDLNVQPIGGVEYGIEPTSDPFETVSGGKTQRRYSFDGPQEDGIRLTAAKVPELLLASADDTEGKFWNVQVTPDLPIQQVVGNPQAVFMVDTSLSSNPDKFNVWLKLLESTLESNRDSLKQFNVLFFNVDAHFWQEKWVDNTPENVASLVEKCNTLALEGATDLYGAIEKITKSDWVHESRNQADGKPASGPDLFLLSDGAANWGETNLRLIGRQMEDYQLGSLFAYQTGLTGTAISGLRFLAGQSGGAVFSVATEDEIKTASTAHRKRPWKLTSIEADGATDIMTAGRVQWVYPGQAITIVGRGDVEEDLELGFEQSGQTKTISISPQRVESELASRLYGQVAVGQLESLGAKVFDVAASYARHFRVTGDTCSLLMLESEADYQRFGIKPEEDLFVIKSRAAQSLVSETLKKSANVLADPKAQLLSWMKRLETMPGMSFKMPTALGLVMDEIQIVAVSEPLDCSLTTHEGLSKDYLAAFQSERLDYDLIAAEAKRRGGTSVDEAIKVFSSLVERNPGDLVIARDVAYTALELGRPAQAYHLLRNVAQARPFEGSIYPVLGQCLTELKQPDMAIVYYEIALEGTFNRMGDDFKKIVSAEYMHLLRQIVAGDLESSVNEFAKARLETLKKTLEFESAEVLITMMWNTDQTDVDLHIIEPSGEVCSYENTTTRSGGQITSDITTGFGPEMYANRDAPLGKYDIQVKYFASDQNRTELRNKVHLTIYRGFGTSQERVTRKTVQLKTVGEKESVATVGVEK